jgi:hypothetical protein
VRTSDETAAGEQARNVTVSLSVEIGGGIYGDLDESGSVDSGDIAVLLIRFGSCAGSCPEDLDGSGEVDAGDIGVLLLLFG